MFKFGVVCFVLAVCAVVRNDAAQLTDAQKSKIYAKLLTSGMECMKDFPLSLEHIKAFRSKKVPDDEVAKCFTGCLYKRLGMMDDTGKISEEKAREATKRIFKDGDEMLVKVNDLITKCMYVNDAETSDGEKGCDRAKLAFECFVGHATKLGLDVEF